MPCASSRGARLGVVVVACGRSPCVGVASVVDIGGAGGGHSRGSRRTLDLEKKKVWRRLNLRRGKVLPLHTGHPLYSRDNIAGTQSSTPPRPVPWPPHLPPLLGFGPLKIHFLLPKSPWPPPPPLSSTQPVAAASNPLPRTSSPPPPPLTARKSRRNATATPPAAAGLRPLKDITQPMAAASNPSPRTSSPPPPPLTVHKSRRNATATRHATPTATTPTTTVTRRREQHRGRNDGDAAAGNSTEAGTTVTPARPTMMATALLMAFPDHRSEVKLEHIQNDQYAHRFSQEKEERKEEDECGESQIQIEKVSPDGGAGLSVIGSSRGIGGRVPAHCNGRGGWCRKSEVGGSEGKGGDGDGNGNGNGLDGGEASWAGAA
ncbi:hypothetical protein EDB85DRAFT_1895011 [Lactarius pseudohatsudake]|nr:hypothetical protein EDB85DRAFT_1895011 [Lactarius pseudohatsudake]